MTLPIVYVDTSCLRGLSLKNPDWQALLDISARGVLKIEISEVAFQERCSQWRDSLKADANNVRNAIDKSDTSGKAGGLMSVTASKADALPKVSD